MEEEYDLLKREVWVQFWNL